MFVAFAPPPNPLGVAPFLLPHTPSTESCPHVSHPNKALMLWLLSQARPPLFFSLCTICLSFSLTCCGCCCCCLSLPLVYVPYCSLPRGRRNVRARSQVLCLIAGRGSSHCVQYANQHVCASCPVGISSYSHMWWCKRRHDFLFCLFLSTHFEYQLFKNSLNDSQWSFNCVKLIHLPL